MTDAERKLWQGLRQKQLEGFRFRRQHPVGAYIADFACIEARVLIEVDGGQHNESARDAARSRWLETRGYRVLRFWNDQVLREPDVVLEEFLRALKSGPPP